MVLAVLQTKIVAPHGASGGFFIRVIDIPKFHRLFSGYLFTYHRENPGEGDNYFVDVYRFIGDFSEEELYLQQAETDGYRLATAQEIEELARQGIFLHYDSIREAFSL